MSNTSPLLWTAIVGLCGSTACGTTGPGGLSPRPCGTASGTGCAPADQRVDLYTPTFSSPTTITNPFYPVSSTKSNVYIGTVGGKPFRSEGTLLPTTRIIHDVYGNDVETLEFQYVAFSDGRLEEAALDWFGQDDLGAVWYFGEDVGDYNEDGRKFTTEGTWLTGRDGNVAMIMPADPKIGDVFRSEDAAPAAFEEITIVGATAGRQGPSGMVDTLDGIELKIDGGSEVKLFAPGYGEFSTGTEDVEPLALSITTDQLTTPPPSELDRLATTTAAAFRAAAARDWPAATTALTAADSAATALVGRGGHPPLLVSELTTRIAALRAAITAKEPTDAGQQAIALARVTFDFRLRHRPIAEVDALRLDLWLAQVELDGQAGADGAGDIRGDTATLEFMWQRIRHTFDGAGVAAVEAKLTALRSAADASDTATAVATAGQLRTLIGNRWR